MKIWSCSQWLDVVINDVWLKLTFVVVIVTNQNMSEGTVKEMVVIFVIAAMLTERYFQL
ncbi:hypothetical protein XBI1_1120008 [Xenorhabdus bovienii str. Intermedium]|uniref:Uncharacterized protein n=1 Tax=Xenorhabdus bovienii str. Intermedium TaxID=1379677 RepID=A0A077QCJ2_XENBV|nr:hypothetical protein XBI1_1120008 [Xenorhabdus bovienii str. Intermedium]